MENTTPRVMATLAELTAGASGRVPIRPGDARSGSAFERVEIDGEWYVVKVMSYAGDWIMRVTGDRDYWTYRLWRSGLMHRLPACVDHTVVAMALDSSGPHTQLGVLMHDVSAALVPAGDTPVSMEQHLRFLDHLAALSAAFWAWPDRLGLMTMEQRLRFFAPETIMPELDRPDPGPVPLAAAEGWVRLAERRPDLHHVAMMVHRDPAPLVAALDRTPSAFLHGDWKMGNLGSHPDGRTVLVDWAYPGSGPPCWDLAWYLALNRERLPQSKDDAVSAFAEALRRRGVDTTGWFDHQVALCLLGMAVTFGWEKALGDDAELDWWAERALAGAALVAEP